MKALGIYVHIPFCKVKCIYCNFVSYPGKSPEEKETYLSFLRKEAEIYKKLFPELSGKSLYLGGGTPTCLTGGQLYQLISHLCGLFNLSPESEITVEANPGTLSKEKLSLIKEAGCNRLSLGVQSFSPNELQNLGRIHSVQDVYNTYELARKIGFANISIDLMYGLPGQTRESWRENLQKAVELKPEHISLYQLSIEKGTPLARMIEKGFLQEFEQDEAYVLFREGIGFLEAEGYHHYEISNFALPGKEAVHNSLYWRNEEYLGIGAGAAGYLQGVRYLNEANLEVYQTHLRQGQLPVAEQETINAEMAMAETMFLGLRLLHGVKKTDFLKKHGISVESKYGNIINKLKNLGLLQETSTHLVLTQKGVFLANEVFQEFL